MKLSLSELLKNKAKILEAKSLNVKRWCSTFEVSKPFKGKSDLASKEVSEDVDGEINRTIVGNTYYWLDSHGDVHIKDCFTESIANRGFKRISHLHDHIHKTTAIVGSFKDVYESKVSWRDLGKDIDGDTVALFADSLIKRIYNEKLYELYKDGAINQHSVGMRYIDLDVAVNDKDDKIGFELWNEIYPLLGNKEKADKYGYFFVVRKAELIEISAVLNGSNEVTPTLDVTEEEPETIEEVKEVKEEIKLKKKESNYYYTI